uniref:Myelin transcription factor 1 n=1 Tax=Mus musculus TaxID=10090 RepID=V9GXW7_MOUSE
MSSESDDKRARTRSKTLRGPPETTGADLRSFQGGEA